MSVFPFSTHVKSISASSKCCPTPGRRQKCSPTLLHRLAQLSAPHPLLCPSGWLKTKNIGVTAKERVVTLVMSLLFGVPSQATLGCCRTSLALLHFQGLLRFILTSQGFSSGAAAPPPSQQHLPSRRRCGAPEESGGEMLLHARHIAARPVHPGTGPLRLANENKPICANCIH